jgi:hypothetical protein
MDTGCQRQPSYCLPTYFSWQPDNYRHERPYDVPPFADNYNQSDAGSSGALDLDDYGIPVSVSDLSQGDSIDGYGVTPWVTATRNLLNNPANSHINVVMHWVTIESEVFYRLAL